MSNHEDFVTYKQAVDLKRLGFDWECNHYYNYSHILVEYIVSHESSYSNWNHESHQDFWHYSAPTLAQAAKWLREVKGIIVSSLPVSDKYPKLQFAFGIDNQDWERFFGDDTFDSYEQALSAGIDKALKILTHQ